MSKAYHQSVLLHESIESLDIRPKGIYVDLTYGGGGHSRAILEKLGPEGRLYAFDQDIDAFRNRMDDSRLQLIHQNFAFAADHLMALGIQGVDGVLADLGVSSFQLDNDLSGFSYREGIPLDMRMDKTATNTASIILNTYPAEKLHKIFQEYGEVRNAKQLAQHIVIARSVKAFEMSQDLNDILNMIKFGHFESYAAPIYQALRMEVNQELSKLKEMLDSISRMIKPNGRLAVITFHSLEDRTVKNFMRYGEFNNEPSRDIFGKSKPWPWKLVAKKTIRPGKEEQKQNPRSRSAKLRTMIREED